MTSKKIQRVLSVSVKLCICGLMLFCIFAIQTGSATVFFQDGTNITGDKLIDTMNKSTNLSLIPFPIQFFYNTHCGSCQEAVDYLNGFTSKYPGISVEYHDLYNSSLNNTMYDQYKTEFNNNTDIHYPVIFIGNVGIAGSQDIKLYTEPVSVWYQNNRKSEMGTGLLSWIQNLF